MSDFIDHEISELIDEKPEAKLKSKIKRFFSNILVYENKEKSLEKLRRKFVNDFPIQRIKDMTMDEYVVGLKRHDTFCYRLENELKSLGNMLGSPANKFGVYYGKYGDDLTKKYRFSKRYGKNLEEAFGNIKVQIDNLLVAGKNHDYSAIQESKLAPVFRGKILSIYYPNDYLAIFSEEHLDHFLKCLSIPFSGSEEILVKQNLLLNWKSNNGSLNDISYYLFARFLYSTFGRPFDEASLGGEIQSERDKGYPKEYASNIKISVNEWKQMLLDPDIFREKDITFLKRIYASDNHASTCYDLGAQDGVSPTTYIKPVVALARRVADWANLEAIYRENNKQVWWRILFWGRYREDSHFEWKLQPKLAKAMSDLYPELDLEEINEKEDQNLVNDLKLASISKGIKEFKYSGVAKEKSSPIVANGHKVFPRDRQVAINALAHAHYSCEIDKKHPTFLRKNSDKNYTEPHHLIPMAFSDEFDVSLDVEENIVSLCSNCHNQIHYGEGADVLLKKLYEERKGHLLRVGIDITFDRLLEMYNISTKKSRQV